MCSQLGKSKLREDEEVRSGSEQAFVQLHVDCEARLEPGPAARKEGVFNLALRW